MLNEARCWLFFWTAVLTAHLLVDSVEGRIFSVSIIHHASYFNYMELLRGLSRDLCSCSHKSYWSFRVILFCFMYLYFKWNHVVSNIWCSFSVKEHFNYKILISTMFSVKSCLIYTRSFYTAKACPLFTANIVCFFTFIGAIFYFSRTGHIYSVTRFTPWSYPTATTVWSAEQLQLELSTAFHSQGFYWG